MRQLHYKQLPGSKIGRDHRVSNFLLDSTYKMPDPGKYDQVPFADKRLGSANYGFGSD